MKKIFLILILLPSIAFALDPLSLVVGSTLSSNKKSEEYISASPDEVDGYIVCYNAVPDGCIYMTDVGFFKDYKREKLSWKDWVEKKLGYKVKVVELRFFKNDIVGILFKKEDL